MFRLIAPPSREREILSAGSVEKSSVGASGSHCGGCLGDVESIVAVMVKQDGRIPLVFGKLRQRPDISQRESQTVWVLAQAADWVGERSKLPASTPPLVRVEWHSGGDEDAGMLIDQKEGRRAIVQPMWNTMDSHGGF